MESKPSGVPPQGQKRKQEDQGEGPAEKKSRPGYQNLGTVGFVDSGIGGAMAAGLVEGHVREFGSQVALPIGDKHPNQIETFTAQMVAQSLIVDGHEYAIIACNTASCKKEKAVEHLENFIKREAGRSDDESQLSGPARARVLELAAKLEADPDYIKDRVLSIVEPTAERAAQKAVNAFNNGESSYSILIDSTDGTVNSKAYPEAIHAAMVKEGFTPVGEPVVVESKDENGQSAVRKTAYTYRNDKGEEKVVAITSRGNPAWVPAIEAGQLSDPATDGQGTRADELVRNSRARSNELQFGEPNTHLNAAFADPPDLNMLCCTHYPAMRSALQSDYGEDASTEFLQQDEVVRAMVQELQEQEKATVTEKPNKISVRLGDSSVSPDDAEKKKQVIQKVVPGREVEVEPLGEEESDQFQGVRRDMEHNRDDLVRALPDRVKVAMADLKGPSDYTRQEDGAHAGLHVNSNGDLAMDLGEGVFVQVKEELGREGQGVYVVDAGDNSVFRFIRQEDGTFQYEAPARQKAADGTLHVTDDGKKTAWKQDNKNVDPKKRGGSVFVAGIPTSQADPELVRESVEFLQSQGLSPSEIRKQFSVASQAARLVASGETRGIGPLSVAANPGESMFNAATDITQIIVENRDKPMEERQSVGIVSGFTVVDNDGKTKLFGENDGPPGAVMLAKTLIQNGTPATLVMDKGSESSFLAAAKAAGLVVSDGYTDDKNDPNYVPPQQRTFENATLVPGLKIIVVDGEGGVEAAKQQLKESNTGLLISTERPSPNSEGVLSNMRGQPINEFNEDLSGLFEAGEGETLPWKTIGIGDGGNEIGLGTIRAAVEGDKKPDDTPVVNNGQQISARVGTDETILASVSNNGAVFLAALVQGQVNAIDGTGRVPPELTESGEAPPEGYLVTHRDFTEEYKKIIDQMYAEGMSLDGVSKKNDQTVDGRELHRPEGQEPAEIGTPDATHDDMFDEFAKLAA
ncbi:hypothetical protein TRICHSKD4_3058 [Roseibium sp. TrichSKD4]|uniref:glutamate cyclase domain-containing protein n=1 Tax=Roseibium sp. TrichSKD4 TaxID=744980 RepID=UPI0001E56B2F|nr:glutamate cyclase domain-containing protein [Roseibium sp. TrichSKD4]EFO31962.1 hypothetical protein TRICHSKD4_3058 [Roseibium sp. TrichSKD4]